MSLTRNLVKPLLAALAAAAVALPLAACGREEEDLSNGKALFTERCGSCHTLGRAGTQGQTGPSLDAALPAWSTGRPAEISESTPRSPPAQEQRDAGGR